MQKTSSILLTLAQSASGLGNCPAVPPSPYSGGGGVAGQVTLKQEDCFVITPNFSAGIGSVYQIEALSPSGNWHKIAGPFTTTVAGVQPVVQPTWPIFGQAIRFNLTSLAGGGTVTVDGYMATTARD